MPGVEHIALSPSGHFYAFLASDKEGRKVGVARTNGNLVALLPAGDDKIRDIVWAGDEHLLIYKSATVDERFMFRYRHELLSVINYDLKRNSLSAVFENKKGIADAVFGSYGVVKIDDSWIGFFGGISLGRNQAGYHFKDGYPDLFAVNLGSGSTREIDEASKSSSGWVISPDGEVIAHARYADNDGSWRLFSGKDSKSLLLEVDAKFANAKVMGVGRDPAAVLVAYQTDKEERYEEVSLEDGTRASLFSDDNVDATFRDPLSGLLIGASLKGERGAQFFERQLQVRYDGMRKAFPGYQVKLLSFTRGLEKMIVRTDGKDDSGTYWLVDIAAGSANPIGRDYPGIQSKSVAPETLFYYQTQDGFNIEAVLTLPLDKKAEALPLVVMPHGGPIGVQDRLGFDYWAQAFASKGYAAMAGVALQNGIYRCAVAVGGVFDLSDFVRYRSNYLKNRDSVMRFWDAAMGVESGVKLASISPDKFAGKVEVPVLLMHGEDDTVVPLKQSKVMYKKLKGLDKDVEFSILKDEDHWLSRSATRTQMVNSSVKFVMRHNPP